MKKNATEAITHAPEIQTAFVLGRGLGSYNGPMWLGVAGLQWTLINGTN